MVRIRSENINTSEYWDARHADSPNRNRVVAEQFNRFFAYGLVDKQRPVALLDVGCGYAEHFKVLRQAYTAVRWSGTDISQAIIEKNRRDFPWALFIAQDITTTELSLNYDYIVSQHSFEHFNNPVGTLNNCIAHAREKVVICVPYGDAWGNEKEHVEKFTLDGPLLNYSRHIITANEKEIFFIFDGRAK